jgi:hypothetical protein
VTRRLLPLLLAVVVVTMASCRVDVDVMVEVAQNGSGVVTVEVTTDAAVVSAAPGLADDIRVDDLRAAGWSVDGPAETAEGGLSMTLTRPFATPEQATALLATINGPNGPLRTLALARDATDDRVRLTLTGALGVEGGLLAFTDPDLLASLGAAPYADDIAASGVDPTQMVGIELRVALAGDVQSTTGEVTVEGSETPEPAADDAATARPSAREVVAWEVPLDGSRLDVGTVADDSLRRGALWSALSVLALVALTAWVVGSVVVIGWVVRVRRRRGLGGSRPDRRATPPA